MSSPAFHQADAANSRASRVSHFIVGQHSRYAVAENELGSVLGHGSFPTLPHMPLSTSLASWLIAAPTKTWTLERRGVRRKCVTASRGCSALRESDKSCRARASSVEG
jgi:hypothetical protein